MVMAEECHLLSIADERPAACTSGAEDFRNEEFECTQCLESFGDRSSLFKHVHAQHKQHVHTRRKFKCDHCDRSFKSMSGLRNHARTHQGFFDSTADTSNVLHQSLKTEDDNGILLQSASNDSVHRGTINYSIKSTELENYDVATGSELAVKSTMDIESSLPQDIVNTKLITSQKSERRRSGIPIPIRRSLYADHVNPESNVTESTKEDVSAINKQNCPLSASARILRSGRQMKKLTPKCERQSPFGKKYKTKASCPITPIKMERTGSPLRIQTPKSKGRTPKSAGKYTSSSGRITPLKNRSTPKQLTPRSIFTNSPSSAKKGKQERDVFACTKCGKSFVDKAKLNVHFTIHSRETPEKCGIEKRLVKKNITSQVTTDSPFQDKGIPKVFPCKKCDQKFENEALLHNHVTSHHNATSYNCRHCDKKFRYQSSLKAHSFVHDGEMPDDMTKRDGYNGLFPEKRTTAIESRSQKYEKFNIFSILSTSECSEDYTPFVCKSCDYSTHLPADLLSHMKTHTRKGQFACSHCEKSYKHSSNLRVHEKIHTINKIKNIIVLSHGLKQRL